MKNKVTDFSTNSQSLSSTTLLIPNSSKWQKVMKKGDSSASLICSGKRVLCAPSHSVTPPVLVVFQADPPYVWGITFVSTFISSCVSHLSRILYLLFSKGFPYKHCSVHSCLGVWFLRLLIIISLLIAKRCGTHNLSLTLPPLPNGEEGTLYSLVS